MSLLSTSLVSRPRLARALPLFVALPLALPSQGCGATPDLKAKEITVAEAEGKKSDELCQNALDRENPFIVEWPGTHKVDLEAISKRGVVFVRFKGCKLEVLPRCEVAGKYKFEPVTPNRDTIEIKDDNDLFSKLPVGSKTLAGELASGRMLKLDYVLVGQQIVDGSPGDTTGDCTGATHYVRTISVGAYNMESAAKANAGADVDVGIVQAGAHTSSSKSRLKNSGDIGACAGKTDIDEKNIRGYGCGAPVRLGLAPLP